MWGKSSVIRKKRKIADIWAERKGRKNTEHEWRSCSVYIYARIAQRILVEWARGFWKHSCAEGRMTSCAASE